MLSSKCTSVVVETSELMLLLVECNIAVFESQLALQAGCSVVDSASTQNSENNSNWSCMLRNMDYSPVEELH